MFGKCVSAGVLACLGLSALAAHAEEVNRFGKTSQALAAFFSPKTAGPGWGGRYVGGSLGLGLGTSTQHYQRAGDHGTASLDPTGAGASLIVGQNWMMGDGFMLGLEGDLGLLSVSEPATDVFDGHIWSTNFGPLYATARGRAGYFVKDDVMLFATGGLAVTSVDDTSIGNTAGETAIERGLRPGLALGAGVEYQWDQQWTVRAEYMHMDFGEVSGRSANDEPYSFDASLGLWRIGASMRF